MIEIQDVIIGFDKPLFKAQDIVLDRGNVYALIGKNGVGKSTFLNSILGTVDVLAGEIKVNSKNIKKLSFKEISKEVAYVPSKIEGIEYLKVQEYISMGMFPYTNWFGNLSIENKQQIDSVIKEMNIESIANEFTSKISDGERQLSSVAKALVQNTDVIILDEPSAFLDYINRKRMIDNLLKISIEKNKCIVLSTHDLDLALESGLKFLAIHDKELKEIDIVQKKELLIYFN